MTYYSLQNKLTVCRFVITSPLFQTRKRMPNPPNCLSTSSGYCYSRVVTSWWFVSHSDQTPIPPV